MLAGCWISVSASPQADRAADQVEPVHHRNARGIATLQLKRDHAAKAIHLALGEGVLLKRGKPGIVYARDRRMVLQHFCNLHCAVGVTLDAQLQRLQTAQDQHRIERSEHRASHVFDADHADLCHILG